MSAEGPGDLDRTRRVILLAADSFDGRDHVMSAAAWELQVTATANSAVQNHPGFVPGTYLSRFTGEDPDSLAADVTVLAVELCDAGMWQRADGGYRVLDSIAIQVCADQVRGFREKNKREHPASVPGRCRGFPVARRARFQWQE